MSATSSEQGRAEARHRLMRRIRAFEDKLAELAALGEIPGPTHEYSGQEAIAVGLCDALAASDLIASTHRGHGHSIARGADLGAMFAELMARETGLNHGRGGSMHVADASRGILGANGMVGAGAPIVTGATWAARQQGGDTVGIAFFGDGAVNQGVLLETMNLASLWDVPIVFACENNGYAISLSAAESTSGDLALRAEGFGMRHVAVDGMDIAATVRAGREAIDDAREHGRPVFLEFETYRYSGHNTGERHLGMSYRTEEEIDRWRARDPLLGSAAIIGEERAQAIEQEVSDEIEAAVAFARSSAHPDPGSALDHMYAQTPAGGLE